jgi:hypothetical protein
VGGDREHRAPRQDGDQGEKRCGGFVRHMSNLAQGSTLF